MYLFIWKNRRTSLLSLDRMNFRSNRGCMLARKHDFLTLNFFYTFAKLAYFCIICGTDYLLIPIQDVTKQKLFFFKFTHFHFFHSVASIFQNNYETFIWMKETLLLIDIWSIMEREIRFSNSIVLTSAPNK